MTKTRNLFEEPRLPLEVQAADEMQEGETVKGGPWDGFEVVSTYSDDQAVEDGILVDMVGTAPFPVNRVTTAVWDHFTRSIGGVMTDVTQIRQVIEKLLAVPLKDGWHIAEINGKKLWAMPNETTHRNGKPGWTVMFPSDY
jgi:hypothetical protein